MFPSSSNINRFNYSSDLVGELINHGAYKKEEGDSVNNVDSKEESIGECQGTRLTRRIYLEMLRAGIDLFSDESLERIKRENRRLYDNIIVKAYGHVNSEKGFRSGINLEGSSEALALLMLFHSIKEQKKAYELQLGANEDRSFWEEGLDMFNHIESILRNAITAESTDDEIKEALLRIKNRKIQLICSGYDWHSEVFLYGFIEKEDRLIYHNRGSAKCNGEEIQIFCLNPRDINQDLLRKVSDRFRIAIKETYPSTAVEIFTKNCVKNRAFPLKKSKWGHCTHASVKAAILSIIAAKKDSISLNQEGIKRIYKRFTNAHRKHFNAVFRKYPPKIA